jgi:hypothetical protein
MSGGQHDAPPEVRPVGEDEALLRRVSATHYPDPDRPKKPQWQAFRPNKDDIDGLSVGRLKLVKSLLAFSYRPGTEDQRNVAQFGAADVSGLDMTVEPNPIEGDQAHALIPELNARDYSRGGNTKTRIKELALQLAIRAEMVLLLDDPSAS